MKSFFVLLIICFFGVQPLSAQVGDTSAKKSESSLDVLYLKNGSVIKGTLVEVVPDGEVKIRLSDGQVFVCPYSEVQRFEKATLELEADENASDQRKKNAPMQGEPLLRLQVGLASQLGQFARETNLGYTFTADLLINPPKRSFYKFIISASFILMTEKETGQISPTGRINMIGMGGIMTQFDFTESESVFAMAQLGGGFIQGSDKNTGQPVFAFGVGAKFGVVTLSPRLFVTRQTKREFLGGSAEWTTFITANLGIQLDVD